MTDAITTAQQISGCETNNTQLSLEALWRASGLVNGLQVAQQYPDFKPYIECLTQTQIALVEIGRTSSEAREQGRQVCLSKFLNNRKTYCTNKTRNAPPVMQALPTGSIELSNTKNVELLKKQQEAKAQKLLAERQAQLLQSQNNVINTLKSNLAKIANSGLSSNPIVAALIQPQIQKIINEISEQAIKLVRDKTNKSKNSIKNSKETFTYPIKPMTPEFTTLSVETPTPTTPTISPLPTTLPETPVPQPELQLNSLSDDEESDNEEIVSEPVQYFVSQFSRSGGKWGALFELIGIGNQYFPNDPIMLLRIQFSNSEESSREAIIQKIKTEGIDGNPPQPDFVWPGK